MPYNSGSLSKNVRAKRCVELQPSVAKPVAKVRAAGTSRRRSIDITLEDETPTVLASLRLYYQE